MGEHTMDQGPPCTNEFRNLFLHSVHGLNIVAILVKILDRSKVQEVLEHLLVFLGPENASKFVKNAVQVELREDGQDQLYFRSLKVGARVSTTFGRLIIHEYVKQVLGPTLLDFFTNISSLDTQVERTYEQDKELIIKYVAKLVSSICDSLNYLPKELVFLSHSISEVSEQINEQEDAQLAQYLLVEIIFPSIADPVACGLIQEVPKGVCDQLLWKISKVMQNIVSEPDFKEDFLEDLKDFIISQRSPIYSFIDKIKAIPSIEDQPSSEFTYDVSVEEIRHSLYSTFFSQLNSLKDELSTVYSKHKLNLIYMLLSNALDSIAPEEQQPLLNPAISPPSSTSPSPSASPLSSPNNSSSSLNIVTSSNLAVVTQTPQNAPNPQNAANTRGNRALTFLTLKRDATKVNEKTKATFLAACRSGDVETVKEFLKGDKQHLMLELSDKENRTPIILASIYNNAALVKYLMQRGSDINHKDNKQWCALHYACCYAHEETMRTLLSVHIAEDETITYHDLIATEKTSEGFSPLNLLLSLPPTHITKIFVQKLIKKGADINSFGHKNETPLVSAIKCGKSNVDIIRFLLEKGADPNLPSEFSAIHWAVKLGEEGVIRVIRELGFPIVAKEAVEEKFVSLQLAQVVQEDNARRQQVLQTKKDIEQSKHEDLKRANKRTNGVTKSYSTTIRTPRGETNFFSSSDLMRLNPIPQPLVKETKRRAKLTPKRRAEILDRKTIQAHELTIYLEYQEPDGDEFIEKAVTCSIPATMTILALLRKCQTEFFSSAGIKWEFDDWRLFMDDEIPLSADKQLWECDLDASDTLVLRVISPEEAEALKDIVFVKLIIPPVMPRSLLTGRSSSFTTPLQTPQSAHTPIRGPIIVRSASGSPTAAETPVSVDGASTPSSVQDTKLTNGVISVSQPQTPENKSPSIPTLQIPKLEETPSTESSPNPSPTPSPIKIPAEVSDSPLENHIISPRNVTRSPRTPITIQVPGTTDDEESQPKIPKLKLSLATINENEPSTLPPPPPPLPTTKLTPTKTPTTPKTPPTPTKASDKQTIIIKIQAHQTLNTLTTDVWVHYLPQDVRDNIDLWYFYLYNKGDGITLNGEMSLGSYHMEFFDIISLKPAPVVSFDVMPEDPMPFFPTSVVPTLTINYEATVKDTVDLISQWIDKHLPKSTTPSSATSTSLSTISTGALPPLPISPPTSRKSSTSRRGNKTISASASATAPRMKTSPLYPTPPPPPGSARAPSPAASLPSFPVPEAATTSSAFVRSASADSASGLGGTSTAGTSAPRISYAGIRPPSGTLQRRQTAIDKPYSRSTSSSSLFTMHDPTPTTDSSDVSSLPSTPNESPRDPLSRDPSPRGHPRTSSSPRNKIVVAASTYALPPLSVGGESISNIALPTRRASGSLGSAAGRGVLKSARTNPELLTTLGITPPIGANLGLVLHMREASCWMVDRDTLQSYGLISGAVIELREKSISRNNSTDLVTTPSTPLTTTDGNRNRVRFKLVWNGEEQIPRPPVSAESISKANLPFSDAILENPKLFVMPSEDKCIVNEVKLVFLGDGRSGKSSLLQSLKKFSSPKDKENQYGGKPKPYEKSGPKIAQVLGSTFSEGLDIEEWMFSSEKDQKHIVFHSWDFVTQATTQQFFLAKGAVYVIVFNIVQERDANIEYWLEMIQTKARGSPVLLCGTHLDDKRIPKQVDKIQVNASKYFQKFQNIVDTSFVSSKSSKGIWEFAAKLVETVTTKNLAGNAIPISYIKLRKRIEMRRMEAITSNNIPIVTLSEFKDMASEYQIENKAAMDALQYLHRSGTVLYLGDNEPALSETVFLDCQWLIRLMSTITTPNLKAIAGILTHPQLEQIWRHYPQSHYEKMLVLMEQFYVLFRLPGSNTYLIPTCLPEERPTLTRDHWPPWEDNANQLVRIFEFQFLPHGFLGRLMIRILTNFNPITYWKSGLLVKGLRNGKDQDAKALIEYNPSLFRVKVSVRYGSASSQGFTRTLWETIHNFTNAWYHNRQRSVLIECPHCLKMHSYDPFIFDLKTAEQAAAEGSQYIYCRGIRPVRIDQVAMDVTLSQVNHMTVPFDALQIQEVIGTGSYATVYKGTWKNKVVAIKQIDLSSIEKGDDITQKFGEFRREVLLMSGLEHPNIVSLKGICLKPFCMITEYLPHGDLKHFLDSSVNEIVTYLQLTWNIRLKIANDIAQGINFLHSATPPIIHRDLKSPNILIGTVPTATKIIAKVADFGLSIRSASQMAGREVWNISWLAPEVMKSRQYTEKVDVYSFGIILWELYTQQMPFEEYKQLYKFDAQLEDEVKRGLRPSIPDDMPPLYRDLIEACWGDDPASRPTFEDILQSLKKLHHVLAVDIEISPPPTPTTPLFSPANPFASPLSSSSSHSSSISPPPSQNIPSTPVMSRAPPSPFLTPDMKSKSLRGEEFLNAFGQDNDEIQFTRQFAPNSGSIQCMIQVNDVMWCGCGDGTISRFDIATHCLLPPAKQEHSDAIYALIQVGKQVWSASKDASMAIWEKNDVSKPVKVVKIPGKDFVTCFAHVGKYVWTGTSLGTIKVWDRKGKLKREMNYKGIVSIGCMSVQEPYVWIGTERLLLMVDMNNYSVVKEMDSHKNMIHNVIPVDDVMWSCSSDKTMKVWTLAGDLIKTIEGHSGRVFCLMHVGDHVWSGSWDKSIFVWDKKKYTFLYEKKGHFKDTVSTMMAVEQNDKIVELWCGSWDKTICNYEYRDPPPCHNSNKILMEGYLMKDSSRGIGKRKRYFVLYKQRLVYFENSKDMDPIFSVSLVENSISVLEDAQESSKRHCFTLSVGDAKFVLYCDTEQEYKSWILALKSVAAS